MSAETLAARTPAATLDRLLLRNVLGHFATGVVAVTAIDPETGQGAGLAANSFTSVSLDPPLVAFCVGHTSTSWPAVKRAQTFAINILAEDQEHVSRGFAMKGSDKFGGHQWTHTPSGAPILNGSLAWIEARVEEEVVAGDHVIVVARVLNLEAGREEPLLFFRGKYARIGHDGSIA